MKTQWGLIVITRDGKTLLPEYEICSSREQAEERARQERSFGMTVIVAFRQVAEWEPVEAAAPETEGPAQTLLDAGVVPFADETGHGFEIDLTTAQPAAEGAREDDGLADIFAEHRIYTGVCRCGARIPQGYLASASLTNEWAYQHWSSAVLASDWLAEDRRRARAEGGAGALEEAAEECHREARWQMEQKQRQARVSTTRATLTYAESISRLAVLERILRDRAAGLRETGGRGQAPRQALLNAAARLTDMGISARAAELLTEWAHE